MVRALDLKGLPLGEARFAFKAGERETEALLDLPVEIRNDIARLEIAGERSAGAVQLLDKRWRRRTVGVDFRLDRRYRAAAAGLDLLSRRARSIRLPMSGLPKRVAPAEGVKRFLDQNVPMMILADVGNVTGDGRDRLNRWIEDGGVLVRFAGPRLAAADDDLVPVKLRRGGRMLGGSLDLGAAAAARRVLPRRPFAGMPVPGDVKVTRQVLAEPDASSHRTDLGDAGRRHAAGDRAAPRQGRGRAVPRHRRHALVRPAALRYVRRHAQADRRARRLGCDRRSAPAAASAPRARSCRRRRVLDGFGAFGPPPPRCGRCRRASADAPPPIIRPASMARPRVCSRSIRWRRPTGRPRSILPRSMRGAKRIRIGEPQDLRGPIFLAALAMLRDRRADRVLAGRRARAG